MNAIRSLTLKKISWSLLLFVCILSVFLGFKAWLTGKQLTQHIDSSVQTFNANKNLKLTTLVKEDNLFSQKIGFELIKETKTGTATLIEGEMIFNHSPWVLIFGESNIEFSGQMAFVELTNDKLVILASQANGYEILLDQLLPFLTSPEAVISISLNGNLNSSGLLGLKATSENFSSIFNPKALSSHDFTLTLNKIEEGKWRSTVHLPSILIQPIAEITMDIGEVNSTEGNDVAKIPQAQPNQWQLEGLTVEFDIVGNNIKIANAYLDHFTNHLIELENISFSLNSKENESLKNYEWQISTSKFSFQHEPLGEFKMHGSLENVSFELVQQLIDKAHLRYINDQLSGIQRFSLPVYYFAQWLNMGEDILEVKPSLNIYSLSLQNTNSIGLNFEQSWRFHSKSISYDKPFSSLTYLPLFYTEQLSFKLSLTQQFLERIISIIQKNYLYNDNSLTVDKLLFSLNQMNQTHPFFITASNSLPNVTPANLLEKDAKLLMDFKLNSQNSNVEWNGKNYTSAELEQFIQNLL